jgi:hypothetical protein
VTSKYKHFCFYFITEDHIVCTELLGLFWTLSIVWYIQDKKPQHFGDRSSLRNVVFFLSYIYQTMDRVQDKSNSSVQHTSSSESFQVYRVTSHPLDGVSGPGANVLTTPFITDSWVFNTSLSDVQLCSS